VSDTCESFLIMGDSTDVRTPVKLAKEFDCQDNKPNKKHQYSDPVYGMHVTGKF
jgi:hypothetical protein